MKTEEFTDGVMKTLSSEFHPKKFNHILVENQLHGIVNNAALLDKAKKALFYGKGEEGNFAQSISTDKIGVDVFHSLLGIITESGEIAEGIIPTLFIEEEPDWVNLDEEIGDMLYYIAVYIRSRGKTFEQFFQANRAKLEARYPEGFFTQDKALNRDLDVEREGLDGS